MTHTSLRNTVGIASLTALALTMVACGGSNSSTPAPTNHAPVISAVSPAGAFSTLVTNHSYAWNITASDVDGDTFTYSASPSAGVTFSGNTMIVTRSAAAAASSISVTATDSKSAASAAVNVAIPAVIADTLPSNLTGPTINQGQTATITLPSSDVDGDSYAYTLATGGTFPGTANLTGNILNLPTTLATPAGTYTQKLSVQQKFNGANIGSPVVIDVTIVVNTAINTAPNFIGNNGVLAPAGRACDPKLIGILTATDSELDQFKYFILSAGVTSGAGTGTGTFWADRNNNGVQDAGEALQVTASPTYAGLTIPADNSNTLLRLFWNAPSDVDGTSVYTIKVGAIDARGAFDTNGFTFTAAGSKNSVASIPTATFTGWAGTATTANVVNGVTGAQTTAATASGNVLEGTATTIVWTNITDTSDGGTTDYPLTATLVGAPAGVTLGNGTTTGASTLTLSGTQALTMSWTPNHLQGRQVHSFSIEVTDAKCTTKKATVNLTLTVNGIIYASEGTGFVFDGGATTNDGSLGTRNVGNDFNQAAAQFSARPYVAGAYAAALNETDANSTTTGGARVDNVAPASFWLVNTTFNPTKFYKTTATPVSATPSFAPAFWGTGLDLYLGQYLQGRNQAAVETATAAAANTAVRFGMTNVTPWVVATDNLVLHIPNLQQSLWYGNVGNAFTTLDSATNGVNFPVDNAVTGSNVTLTIPTTAHLWAAGGSAASTADADFGFLTHNRTASISASAPKWMYTSAIQAVALKAQSLTTGITNDIQDAGSNAVFNMTSTPTALSVPMNINRNAYNQYVSSVHGQVANIAYSSDDFNVGAALTTNYGPTNNVVTLFRLPFSLGHANNLNSATTAANQTFAVTNPLDGFGYQLVTNYTYTFAVTNMAVDAVGGANAIASQIATMGSNTPGAGYATSKAPGILPILNPRVYVTGGLSNVNIFPPYSVVAGNEAIDLGAGSSAAGFRIQWTYDSMNGALPQATTQSGLVINLYPVTIGAPSTVAAAPSHTYFVGTGVNSIEVPPAAVGAGYYIVRIMNVSTSNGGTLINFDVTPNLKGYPYHWAETVGAIRVQ